MCKIFVALNFHGPDHQRKFFNVLPVPCVKKRRLTSELAAFEAMVASILTYPTPVLQAVLLATGHRFCHYAIRHEYSCRRNGKRGRSLGVRKPISLLKVPKKSHRHSLTISTPDVSKLDDRKVISLLFFLL